MLFVIALALAAIVSALYYYFIRTFNYWKKRNVPGPAPVPFFGNLLKSALRYTLMSEVLTKIYNDFPKEKVVGIFTMTTPAVLIRDLDVIKHVMIKDFDNFVDRGVEFSKEGLGVNLFHADGETWRILRRRFSPLFTNQKLNNMMYLLTDRADTFTNYVREISVKSPEHRIGDLVQKYTMSTIAACAFGLDVDTFNGNIDQLKRIDKAIFSSTFLTEFDMMYPGVLKSLNMSLFPEFINKFFKELVQNVITQRNGVPSNRRDFMDLILELRTKKELQEWNKKSDDEERVLEITDSIIEAQAFVFYAAGYETSASTMGFMLYHLAIDTAIQDKLTAEIDEYLRRNNNQITLDNLKELKYLEQVFNEALRMYPIVDLLQRSAINEYNIPGTDVKVGKGQMVWVAPMSIHYDEKYYPNPEKFDPERFTPENVAARHSCAYLPFGIGPRHCIGMRFAEVQSRVCVVRLLSKFRLEPSKNTARSFRFDPYRVVLSPLGGLYVNIFPRKDV